MAQRAIFHLQVPRAHMVPVRVPAVLYPIQLPACGLGKQWKTTQVFEIQKLFPSGFKYSAPAFAAIWGVNQLMELFLSINLPFQYK